MSEHFILLALLTILSDPIKPWKGTVSTPVKKKAVMFVKCAVDYYTLRGEVAYL